MNANVDQDTAVLSEEWGERICAYIDNELAGSERAEVEQLLATNAEARRMADDFLAMRGLCHAEAPVEFERDLSRDVMAEALRQQAGGDRSVTSQRPDAHHLEPDGEFGLPFGKTARGWAWAGVAAAAALMISFYGRPAGRGPVPDLDRSVAAMQRAMPGLQVVDIETTPARWRQVLGQQLQAAPSNKLPVALVSAKRSGLQMEAGAPTTDARDQLLYVDGGMDQVNRVRRALMTGQNKPSRNQETGTLHQVGPDASPDARGPTPALATTGTAASPVRVVRLTIRVGPNGNAAVTPGPTVIRSAPQPSGTPLASNQPSGQPSGQPVVLRIRFREP